MGVGCLRIFDLFFFKIDFFSLKMEFFIIFRPFGFFSWSNSSSNRQAHLRDSVPGFILVN